MPKITAVEPQKKNPHRFNIFLDGVFAFGADEDLVVEYRLISGKTIDQQMVEKLLFEAEVGKLMGRMYVLFNIRQRSEKEIRDYLKNLSFKRKLKNQEEISIQAIDLVIEKLKQKMLLNDEEFAKSWVEARSKKKGIQLVKSELYKKGISKDVINKVTSQLSLIDQQESVATKLLERRLPRFKKLPLLERKKKSYGFLLGRGFDYELVQGIIENLMKKR